MQYLCAPMEGVTGDLFRQAQRQTFSAADSYYTPFLSPTANRTFSPRELREIEPAHNAGIHVVPQLMGHCAEDFLWMAGRLADMGYDEVNFNLGCPSNTVTAKKKGAGLLTEPDLLRRFFDAVFAACPLPVSVKTRLGKATAETFPALLELYNDYPICELIVHPRVQADQYHGHPDLDMFAYALPCATTATCLTPRPCARFRRGFRPWSASCSAAGWLPIPASSASCAPAPCRRRHSFRRFTTGFTPPRARASPTGARCCFA